MRFEPSHPAAEPVREGSVGGEVRAVTSGGIAGAAGVQLAVTFEPSHPAAEPVRKGLHWAVTFEPSHPAAEPVRGASLGGDHSSRAGQRRLGKIN